MFVEEQAPRGRKTRQGGGQSRQTRLPVGANLGPRIGKAHGVRFRPTRVSCRWRRFPVVGCAGQGGDDVQRPVGVDDLELCLKKIIPAQVHFVDTVGVATC